MTLIERLVASLALTHVAFGISRPAGFLGWGLALLCGYGVYRTVDFRVLDPGGPMAELGILIVGGVVVAAALLFLLFFFLVPRYARKTGTDFFGR